MKKLLVATTFLAMSAVPSISADLPTKAAYAAPPPWSWSGFYVGATAGGGWSSLDNTVSGYNVSVPLSNGSASGATAGIYAGYNYILWDRLLVGVETDIAWTNIRNGGNFNGHLDLHPGSVPWAAQADNRLSWLGTLRGRVGYAFGRVLPYVTGGLAYGEVKTDGVGVIGSSSINSHWAVPFNGSSTQVGWTFGGGLEYAITDAILARLEYLHYDLGTANWAVPNAPGVNVHTDASGNLARVGIAAKF